MRINFLAPPLTFISIIDFINLSFLAVITLFYLKALPYTPHKVLFAGVYALLLVSIFVMASLRRTKEPGRYKQWLMFTYPIIFLFIIFETFFMILPFFNSLRFDDLMIAIDFSIVGVHPTVWVERWMHPLLTDLMYLFYVIYFPLPLIILGCMFRKSNYRHIEQSFFIYLLCYYGAYLMYFAIPVEGPRFHLVTFHTVNLDGYILAEPIRRIIDFLEPNKFDAFPSVHASILLITMLVTYEHKRPLFYYFVPLAAGITISLIYCRYHYVIDVIVGFAWAATCYPLGKFIYGIVDDKFISHFWNVQDEITIHIN
jgi:membrane-associated phospholipid phosphatase